VSVRRRASGRVHYNYFRDYDPTVGRYVESDPIGLKGGIGTYSYSNANPIQEYDHLGLVPGPHTGPRRQHGASGTWSMGATGRWWELPKNSCGADGGARYANFGAGYSFEQACQNHDRCYSTCGKSKNECDTAFLNDMMEFPRFC
jgi:RHS repeat-associated protein